jgi:2-C-methyl-D-erythritol 4-phosphate cytidylyltransferase
VTDSAALGIVPVDVDDRSAPLGCAALRTLRGRALVAGAAGTLVRSGAVRRVVVCVPPALADAVSDALVPLTLDGVEVLPAQANGTGHRVRAALAAVPGSPEDAVVVHDPLHPLAPPGLVREVLAALGTGGGRGGCEAVVPGRQVTDTLKWVDEDAVVRGTADRETYRMIYSPQAYRRRALERALGGAGEEELRSSGADVLPRLVQAAGGLPALVGCPEQVFRIASDDDLLLAEAMLHVSAGGTGRE